MTSKIIDEVVIFLKAFMDIFIAVFGFLLLKYFGLQAFAGFLLVYLVMQWIKYRKEFYGN